ncbi:MAG: hypothetical protein WCO56_22805 [Verrucomicrobiota bacterium]
MKTKIVIGFVFVISFAVACQVVRPHDPLLHGKPEIATAGSDPQSVLAMLPSEEALGPAWKREIGLLFDPLSQPSEILHTASPFPDSFKKEIRATVEGPEHAVSGWSNTHFTFQNTNRSCLYEVQIERYRNKEQLRAGFEQLLTFASYQYRKAPVNDLGDAAVFYQATNSTGATLWFRRGNFKVRIAAMNDTTHWEQDSNLQHLAKTLDQRILRGADKPEKVP